MKGTTRMVLAALGLSWWQARAATAAADASGPIGTVLKMIDDYSADFKKAGERQQQDFEEYAAWCEDRSRELSFEIKTGKSEAESLTASIAEEAARIHSLGARVEELGSGQAGTASKLEKAVAVREEEAANFAAEEKELMQAVDMLRRAAGILEHNAQGGAAMLQLKNVQSLTQAFSVMLGASLINSADASALTALVQNSQSDQEHADAIDEEEAPGAPSAATYETQTGTIMDTLQDLLDKAEGQLSSLRQAETKSTNSFELMKQSLQDENRFAGEDMEKTKKDIAASSERKAVAEGEIKMTTKEVAEDEKARNKLRHACMEEAEEFKNDMNGYHKTITVLAAAKEVISGMLRDGSEPTAAVTFLQAHRAALSSRSRRAGPGRSGDQAVRAIRALAFKQHSTALVQLATRMEAALVSSGGIDPFGHFGKVRQMITEMVAKLEDDADSDASRKAYCDKELAETREKKDDKTEDSEVATTRIDQATAKSSKLKEEVALLENELSKLAKSQARLDQIRQREHEEYTEDTAWGEKAMKAGHMAVKLLTEHFGSQEENQGKPSGQIISYVEGLLARGSQWLANVDTEEQERVNKYKELTGENEIERATKEQDVKYKTKESKELDKYSAELSSDLRSLQEQLSAISEYLAKVLQQCTVMPLSYEERTKRRAAEIQGLKEALDSLDAAGTFLLQRGSQRTEFRDKLRAAARS